MAGNPVLLEGYGGYGISMVPAFLGSFGRLWLNQGGVYVVANLRGGAEYGEEWHKAGNLTQKQNVFDDFVACAEHLVARQYTAPAHLAIIGGSNGGLLMGAAFTQRPDLFRGRRVVRRNLRHAAGRARSERGVQHDGVRHRQGRGPVQGAVRILPVPPRQGRDAPIRRFCSSPARTTIG